MSPHRTPTPGPAGPRPSCTAPPAGAASSLRATQAGGTAGPRLSRRAFAALTLPAALGLASCGGSGARSGPLRIVDYYNTPTDDEVISATFQACAEELGLAVRREKIPGDQLIPKVLQMGSSRTMPDLLMLDNPDLQQVAASGALLPLEDYGLDTQGFTPSIAELGRYQGALYGIAPTVNTIALFYDVAALAEAGIEPPTTWEQTREAARALTTRDRYGIAFSAIASYEGTWQFMPFLWSNGGDEADLATPEVAGASRFWSDLVSEGSASRSVVNWGQGDVIDQFTAGNAAMVVNGPWNIAGLRADAPELDWDVVILPVPEVGDTSVAPLGGEVWTVPATGDREREAQAAALLKAFVTPEKQLVMGRARNTIPADAAAAAIFAAENPDLSTFVEQASTARSRTARLGPEWPRTAKAIYTANQQVLVDGTDPAEAFDLAARTVA